MNDFDWNNRPVRLAQSDGGSLAFADPWRAVVRGNVEPWPPPELLQKAVGSSHERHFSGDQQVAVTESLDFYSDLQSTRSEDAVTWSLFGPLAYANGAVRAAFAADLFSAVWESRFEPAPAHVWLWRRLLHPEKQGGGRQGGGGPEIDFAVQTARTVLLGEAKWSSPVGAGQGVNHDRDQIELRVDICRQFGRKLFPTAERFAVLLLADQGGALTEVHQGLDDDRVRVVEATWTAVGGMDANPYREEFLRYLDWRRART